MKTKSLFAIVFIFIILGNSPVFANNMAKINFAQDFLQVPEKMTFNNDEGNNGISSNSEIIKSPQILLKMAQEQGAVRVVVGLNIDFIPEGELRSPLAVDRQQQQIAQAQENVLKTLPGDVTVNAKFEIIPYMALTVDEEALQALLQSSEINYIQEDRLSAPTLASTIPLIGADVVHAGGTTGTDWTVAVLDSGVQWDHEFLGGTANSRVVDEACFSTTDAGNGSTSICAPAPHEADSDTALCLDGTTNICAHGTHVAGIAAGSQEYAMVSYDGVAPDANVIAVQVFSRFPAGSTYCGIFSTVDCVLSYDSDLISGLQYVYNQRGNFNIAAVNMSLGGGRYYDEAACDADEAPTKAVIDSLRSVGIATVISSGNSSYKDSIGAPGCISTAVAVGATDDSDVVASFSNSSNLVELLAPGVSVDSSVPPDNGVIYDNYQGTSMAAPHVTGAWALIKQNNPTASVSEVLNILQNTGVVVTDVNGIGIPRIQVDAALSTGEISGTVTDISSGIPIQDAVISAVGGSQYTTTSDVNGQYSLWVPAGNYDVTASAFGYQPVTQNSVAVLVGATTTADFTLAAVPSYLVSGVVTDASTGWPLYASIDIPGYPGSPVWTDPVTGAYSVTLPAAVTHEFTVSAWVDGYTAVARMVGPLVGDSTEDFALFAGALVCNAPGYTLSTSQIFSHSFEGGGTNFPSSNWEQVVVSGNGGNWTRPSAGTNPAASPHTGSKLASFNSYTASSGSQTRLYRTSGLNLSSYANPVASFWFYHGDCGWNAGDRIQFQVSTNGGTVWNNVGTPVVQAQSGGWQQYSFDLSTYAGAGMTDVRLGFLGISDFGCNLHIDDVVVVENTCTAPVAGGLVVGNVYDGNTLTGLNGAAVSNEDGYNTTSAATPDDPNVDDGFYTLFSPAGDKQFTALFTNYVVDVDTVPVVANDTVRHDFYLGSGLLSYVPAALDVVLPAGSSGTRPFTITNSGSGAANFSLLEVGDATAIGLAWQSMTPLPEERVFHAVVADANFLYVIGGTSDAGATTPTNTNFRYDTLTDSWTTLSSMPVTLDSIDGIAIDDKIYIPGDSSTATTYVYDIINDSWSSIATNNGYSARSQYQVVAIGTDLYVLGGIIATSNASTTEVWRLDTTTGIWSAETSMQNSRTSFSAAAIAGEIYVAGGVLFPGFTPDMTSEKYDGVSWQYVASLPDGGGTYTRWSYNADGSYDGKLWLGAGRRDAGWNVLNHAAYYDPVTDTWIDSPTIPSLSQGRVYMEGAVGGDGYFYVIGGRNAAGDAIYAINERLQVAADIPWLSEAPTSGTISAVTDQPVDVTFDASSLTPGQYTGQLAVTHDTPSILQNVPITLTVVTGYLWNGNVNSDWDVAANWTPNGVPDGFASVVIDPANLTGAAAWPVLNVDPTVVDLRLETGAELTIPNGRSLTVNHALTNNGLLRQEIDIQSAALTRFLHITGSGGDAYYGVDITPADAMGLTTVEIRGNQATGCNQGDQLAQRCFDISPTTPQEATVRFWYLHAENNGEDVPTMKAYHWNGGSWDQLDADGELRGTEGPYEWVEVDNVDSYSPFGLADGSPNNPTAVSLQTLYASTPTNYALAITALLFLTLLTFFSLRLRRR